MENKTFWQEGVDSKALLVCLIKKLPILILLSLTGAIIGGGLNLVLALYKNMTPVYINEKEYYIQFRPELIDAKDYYNDFTWNDVLATDEILGVAMEELGSSYDRNEVKEMLHADILSDVKYLTITVTDKDKEKIDAVSVSIENALVAFGDLKYEFIEIYKIEDCGTTTRYENLFSWRFMLLGACIFAIYFIISTVVGFLIGDCIYSCRELETYFGINALGTICANENGIKSNSRLDNNISFLVEKNNLLAYKVVEMTTASAEGVLEKYNIKLADSVNDLSTAKENDRAIILLIPFGIKCRQQVEEVLSDLRLRDIEVAGAILVNVDPAWEKLYYGKVGKA